MMLSMRTSAVRIFFVAVLTGSGGDGASDDCRTVHFKLSTENKVLENHVIRSLELPDEDMCQLHCYQEPDCVSINYGPSGNGKQLCELNDRNHLQASSEDFVARNGYIYRTVLNSCLSNPCSNAATCQTGFTSKGYRCICPQVYEGEHCETAMECLDYRSLNSAERKLTFGVASPVACDKSLGPGWFRFQGAAGKRMPTSCTPTHKCGTHATGWLNGAHPTVVEGRATRQVCFNWGSNCCKWSIDIQVRNCGTYFVYYFSGTPASHHCHLTYCGTD